MCHSWNDEIYISESIISELKYYINNRVFYFKDYELEFIRELLSEKIKIKYEYENKDHELKI